jgi:SCY1-like protein 2
MVRNRMEKLIVDIMTLVYNALGGATILQEKALVISAELVDHLDFITVKSALFPKVANVFTHTTTLGTKVATLECFLKLVPKLDNVSSSESVLI